MLYFTIAVASFQILLCACLVQLYNNILVIILHEVNVVSKEMVHVGFGNILAINRVIAIASPNSAPTKRTIQEARNKGILVDMTNGRRTKAVIFVDSGHIVLAALAPETISGRLQVNCSSAAIHSDLNDEAV